jgi:hypothetical protein
LTGAGATSAAAARGARFFTGAGAAFAATGLAGVRLATAGFAGARFTVAFLAAGDGASGARRARGMAIGSAAGAA